ncbi:MAG: creatininase family protein [Rubellimicrobium sp.]|nr:creatininase family protein [Rubellimicrobium sp.]
MQFERMRPAQIRAAVAASVPFVLPIGVQEYHGEHLPVGMDLLAVTEAVARLGDEVVVLPPFAWGTASHAVAGPATMGTYHVPSETILPMAQALFAALLVAGIRNIHGIIHHQTENFLQGMPTDLAFRLAARNAVFAHLEETRGKGWWGAPESADYYSDFAGGENPFNWISIHPLLPPGAPYPFDHAGKGETGLMLALAPETVDMGALDGEGPWYVADAHEASAAAGEAGVAIILDHLRRSIGLAGS